LKLSTKKPPTQKSEKTIILAIDTSCDDTSVAVSQGKNILSNIVASQNQIHKKYGGVFPTMAKQAHKENIDACVKMALEKSGKSWEEIDAIAVTQGPGLAPALEIGIQKAKDLAITHQKKLIAINHIEAHAISSLAEANSKKAETNKNLDQIKFPVLAMVISGGHSEFIFVREIADYQKLGQTIDDAAGECLDKVGRMLNLGYPAGPIIEDFAKKGDAERFEFPKPMTSTADFDLSFSGLKTAARNMIRELEEKNQLDQKAIFDFAASFQKAVFDHINYKLERILFSSDPENKVYPPRKFFKNLEKIKENTEKIDTTVINEIWLGGGVAANNALRQSIRQTLKKYQKITGKKIELKTPYKKKLCSDNAAMIALVAYFKYQKSEFIKAKDLDRQARLSLD
jgi:N6-L-threonylcarbamoyladenine synthase